MKKLFTIAVLTIFLLTPFYGTSQGLMGKFGKKKNTEQSADTTQAKGGMGLGKMVPKKKSTGKLFAAIGEKKAALDLKRDTLITTWGDDYRKWEEFERESDAYFEGDPDHEKAADEAFKELEDSLFQSKPAFEQDIASYKKDLKKLNNLTDKLAKRTVSNFQEDYVTKYGKYHDKRPEAYDVELDPAFWMIIVQDAESFTTLQDIIKLNSLLYRLSTIYTDLYFKNDNEIAFFNRIESDWMDKENAMIDSNASEEEIELEYIKFVSEAQHCNEYQSIIVEKSKARSDINEALKEMGFSVLQSTLQKLLGMNSIKQAKRPDSIGMKDYVKLVKGETKKAKDVLGMLTRTIQGTSLVTRQATKSCVVAIKNESEKSKTNRYIVRNGDIEILVENEGNKIKRTSIIDREDSMEESLAVKGDGVEESLKCYKNDHKKRLRIDVADAEISQSINSVIKDDKESNSPEEVDI